MNLTPDDQIVAPLSGTPHPEIPPPTFLQRAGSVLREAAQPGSARQFGGDILAGLHRERFVDSVGGDDRAMEQEYAPVVEAVNAGHPGWDQLMNPAHVGEEGAGTNFGLQLSNGQPITRSNVESLIWQRMDELRKTNPGAVANLPKGPEDIRAAMLDAQRQAAVFGDAASQRSPLGAAGNFVGQLAGGATEPLNMTALMFGAPPSASLLRTFITEGTLNTALDVASLPSRLPRYERIQEPMSGGDVAAELGGDFVLGGAIPTGFKAGARFLQGRPLIEAFDKAVPDPSPTAATARAVVENAADLSDANPHAATDPGRDLTRIALDTTDRATQFPDAPIAPADTTGQLGRALDPNVDADLRKSGFTVQSFDPDTITTDAAAMQYKSGGDAEGVTDRLQGVEQWDPAKAGLALVWERNDGTRVIADGHQRLGLAQRLKAAGQDTPFFGVPYREADGYTAPMMRTIAAAKNIAEGSGGALDAARVLREAPELARELPPRAALVRQARDLASLSDDAFGMAWNGVARERDAALVGKHVRDPQMQTAILGHLAKDSPDTLEEADLFVRQALAAGASKEVQSDMFGNFLSADLVLPERVKILKGALTSLRKDRSLFATLTGRENRIAAAGNVLDTAANAAEQETAARAFVTLKALAERKGPISDALQAAAERAVKGHSSAARTAATRDFLDAIRAAARSGDLTRDEPRGALGDLGSEAEGAAVPENRDTATQGLDLFGEPAAKPEAFVQQSQDLARELAPAREEPVKAAAAPAGEQKPQDEFGPAQSEIENMRAIEKAAGKDATLSDPDAPEDAPREISIKTARSEMERQARAVERLRGCVED